MSETTSTINTAASAAATTITKAATTKKGTYTVKKMNMYLNADGTPIAANKDGTLEPVTPEAIAICEDFVKMGYLVANK